ncbi:MAG: cation:proton antiporter [Fibrobacterales bacterium]
MGADTLTAVATAIATPTAAQAIDLIFSELSIIIIVSGILSVMAIFMKQPILIGYILAGVILGPSGLAVVKGMDFLNGISQIGVTLLLFLAGLGLQPHKLKDIYKQMLYITLFSGLIFSCIIFSFSYIIDFTFIESMVIGVALMFSSTILVVKLLPTTTLHQQHMGALSISILIIQDIIAVSVITFIKSSDTQSLYPYYLLPFVLIVGVVLAFLFERYVIRKIIAEVDQYHEVLYLGTIAWCFALAFLAHYLGFSYEIGAFIAGVTLANNPISRFLAEGLKFFRDFFLAIFFFTIGAKIDFVLAQTIIFPAIFLGVILCALKPQIYLILFRSINERKKVAKEISYRLGQSSEFSLIMAFFALEYGLISGKASQFIQIVTVLTMVISSYTIINFFPTPLGTRKKLHRN